MLDTRRLPESGNVHRHNAVASHDAAEPVLDLLRPGGILLLRDLDSGLDVTDQNRGQKQPLFLRWIDFNGAQSGLRRSHSDIETGRRQSTLRRTVAVGPAP